MPGFDWNRREFLKIAAGTSAALALPALGQPAVAAYSEVRLANLCGAGEAIRELKLAG